MKLLPEDLGDMHSVFLDVGNTQPVSREYVLYVDYVIGSDARCVGSAELIGDPEHADMQADDVMLEQVVALDLEMVIGHFSKK